MNDSFSVSSQISDESTIKATCDDLVDHVNINDIIFDDDKAERPPFSLDCGCCARAIKCNRSLVVLSCHYGLICVVVSFCIGFLVFAQNSPVKTGIIAILSTCVGYLIPKSNNE